MTNLSDIHSDGTLWSWGNNGYGRLGLGGTTRRSSPCQVGVLTSWSSVSFSKNHHRRKMKLNQA